jgi:hypothetical protein
MKFTNAITISQIENRADTEGRGSIWRACLAVERSCNNEVLGDAVSELGLRYCLGQNILKRLQGICSKHMNESEGEFREALRALENAIEMAPKGKSALGVDEREDLWIRLNRLIK